MGLTADKVNASGVKGLFHYNCGFEFCKFESLCQILNISVDTTEHAPLHLQTHFYKSNMLIKQQSIFVNLKAASSRIEFELHLHSN